MHNLHRSIKRSRFRSVAQPGRALRSGRRGRWFEPSHSDQNKRHHFCGVFCFARMCGFEPARKAVRTAGERQTAVCRFASTRTSQGRAPAQPSHSDQNKRHHFCGVFCFARIYSLCSILYALKNTGQMPRVFISPVSRPSWRLCRQIRNCC